MLSELRALQLTKYQASETRIAEAKSAFELLDVQLSGSAPEFYTTRAQEVMTSADFTYAIQEFVQRQMLPGYKETGFAFEPLVKPDVLPNYLPVSRYQNRGGADDLEYVGEKGEPRPGSIDDATKRMYQVYKWEKQYELSMEAIVNDDLGYFQSEVAAWGRAARRSLEKFVARFFTNATTIARLIALGVLYSSNGRLSTTRISEARMAFTQRVNTRGEIIANDLKYIVYHLGLKDVVATIQASTLVPENATNAVNVVKGTFEPIACPYIAGVAPNLPWFAFSDWKANGVIPFVLARRQGMAGPMIIRKKSDQEAITALLGTGTDVPPVMGDFATGNLYFKVIDEFGTYINATDGNMFDHRGCWYAAGTAV
jgi:hypothetical protein